MGTVDDERLRQAKNLEQLKNYRLLDDDFMTVVFENSACAELLLRIILNKPDLRVINVDTQEYKKKLFNRSVILDIYATDSDGKKYDVEVQRSDRGAGFKRARYNGSLMDATVSEPGMKCENLPDVYVIFITENDVIGYNLPLYHYQTTCLETKEVANDGKYTIYVNSLIQDETALGKLMHDFWCKDPDEMLYDVLAERVRYFKENEEGIRTMCKAMEDRIDSTTIILIKNLMKNMQVSAEKAMEVLEIPKDDIPRLMPLINA